MEENTARPAEELAKLLERVICQARAVGVPVSPAIEPEVWVNYRAQNRFGCCKRAGGRYTIELSWRLLTAEEQAVCQVLAHEVLHSCPGCANHGERWKDYAGRMNRAYGYAIARTDSFEGLHVADERKARYVVRCTQCGRVLLRLRKSPLTEYPERYRCVCGGRFAVSGPG